MSEVMYKVGDKVRVIGNTSPYHYYEIGQVATVCRSGYTGTVDLIDSDGVNQQLCLADIEPYTTTPTTFQVGKTYTTAAGHANKCIHIENGIAWCVSARDDGTAYGPAYTWDMEGNYLNAPPSECALYKITFGPTVERKTVIASVDYVDGAPDWGTVDVVG